MGLNELWVFSCIRTCLRIYPCDYDVILATGSPFSTFVAARYVARHYGIPYVMDYRDPWSLSALNSNTRMLASVIGPLECQLIRDAAATVMVSPSHAKNQEEKFQMVKCPSVITNGYDPEQFDKLLPKRFPEFSVVYAGSFYVGHIEIDPVLKAIKEAAKRRGQDLAPICLHYYGNGEKHVKERANAYGVDGLVVCHGHVPRSQVLAAIKGAGATAVIASIREHVDLAECGIITGKIFEPLGMGVPILLVASERSDATLLVEMVGGGRSFRASQVDAMAQWLVELASDPLRRRSYYDPPKAYSWSVLAKKLDEVLLKAIIIK
jgi:glycosyltransferase involved in cell wall biosynthesis